MPSWGQAAWGALCTPILSPHGCLAPPAIASDTSSYSLSWSLRSASEALLLLPFPELRAPGEGQEEQPGGKRTEDRREGELEQTKLGPELGTSGTVPISSILVQLSDHRPELVGWYLF